MLQFIIAFLGFCIVGAFAGLLAGLLGLGGGIIVIPSLLLIFLYQGFPNELLMHTAAGTSLAAMLITTFVAMRTHLRHEASLGEVFWYLVPGLVVGTIAGTTIANYLSTKTLRMVFACFVVFIAGRMIFSKNQPEFVRTSINRFWHASMSVLIGGLSGLLGIGGGSLLLPYLIHVGIGMRHAIAVTTASGFLIAIVGTLSFAVSGTRIDHKMMPALSTGFIYWPAVIGIGVMSPWFAILGAKLSRQIPVYILKRIFAVFLLFVAVLMFVH